MSFSGLFRSAMLSGVAIAIVAPAPAFAQSIAFDIPARDLDGALQQFALTSNREILYSPALVADRRSPGVVGTFTPEEALRRLLSGTEISFRRTSPGLFVLERGNGPAMARTTAASLQTPMSARPTASAGAAIGDAMLIGTVFDETTGTPIAGARVTIEGTDRSAVTDSRGVYRFPGIGAGEHVVVLDYLGDAPQRQSVTVASGASTTADFVRGVADQDTIVVLGFNSAIQAGLNQQRTAPNNSTVVSEDLLGGFPAETVSEALRRVPGVAFGRAEDSGEGSKITVRGFSSEAINVQVNGLELQGTNFERTIDLSGYLADNIQTITIHKSLLPSHEATGSGGLVEIETRSGLDYGDFHFSASVEGERALDDGFGHEWQASGTIGGKITPNLGIVGSLSYRDTNRRNFDVSVLDFLPAVMPAGFTSVTFIPASQQFPFDEEINSRLINTGNYTARDRDETTLAASVNLAWDIGDHTRLRLDLQRNQRQATTLTTRSGASFLTLGVDMPIPELGGEVRRRTVLNSFRPIIALAETDLDLTTNVVSLRGDTNVGRWQFRYKAGYTGARSQSENYAINLLGRTFTNIRDLIDPAAIVLAPDDDAARTIRVIDGGFVSLPNGVPVPAFSQAGIDAYLNPSSYRINNVIRSITDSPTDAWIAEGSARYSPETWLDYVEVGFKYDRSERSALDDTFAVTTSALSSLNTFISIAGRDTFLDQIDPALLMATSLSPIGLNFAIPSLDAGGAATIFDALAGLTADDPSTPFNEERFRFNDFSALDPISSPSALSPAESVEDRLAGYLETHVEFGDFDVISGLRMERTTRTGTAITVPSVTLPVGTEPRETFIDAGLIDFVDTTAVDTTLTPSLLINYRPQSNIVARLGYFRSTVNPSLQQLRRQTQYILNFRTNRMILREGNPDLKPTTTDNFDLDLAYYFRDTPGLVRVGAFYKKTNNNFTNLLIQDQPADVRQRLVDYLQPLAASRPDLLAFDEDTEFLLSRPVNGEGGVIWGLEAEVIRRFDFLPGFLGGFGVIGNVTYTKGDFPTLVSGRNDAGVLTNFTLDRPLEDQAAWVYNAALTYAGGGFEGRLIYTHQDVTVTSYEIHDLNTVIPSYSTLDLRLSYNFNGPWGGLVTLFLEGDDLLHDASDPDIRSATASTPGREDGFFFPNTFQFNGGRTFTAGARVRF